MLRRTYGEMKSSLRLFAGEAGLDVTDSRLLDVVNTAQEALLAEAEWRHMVARYKICMYGELLVLPSEFERLIAVSIDKNPWPINDPWFEFLEFGPGMQDWRPIR